ncbi:MAG: hypothetical protein JO013_00615 [Alphaproteobacteria bacterium]|nr:hypothetical protein [Alphaproteobacteria bacterium]
MLSLRAALGDLVESCELVDGGARFGGSRVEVFRSPQLHFSAAIHSQLTVLWIGEGDDPLRATQRSAPNPEAYRNFLEFEGVAVFLRQAEGGAQIEIARTTAGSCPLYVSAENGVLTCSWRFEDAVLALAERRPDVEACRLLLEHGTCQVRNTVIERVHALWPGEAVAFDRDGLVFREITEAEAVVPGSLRDDARATDELMRIIETVLRPRIDKARSVVVEVSGGYDSSLVALAASKVRRPLHSYGLVHGGAMGAQQRNRRQELISLCELSDAPHSSGDPGPLAGLEFEECSLTANDDIFRMACARGVDLHPAQPFDLILTGIGGDELTGTDTFYRREWEVYGPSSLSTMVAAAGRCDMFMRRGIWVFQPLAHPHVVNFCRALPEKIRARRTLPIIALARAGLSDGFLFPRFHEHYGNLVQYEASQFDFEKALGRTIVADYGIQDYGPLLARAYEAGTGGFSYSLVAELWGYLKLDLVLKRYLTA